MYEKTQSEIKNKKKGGKKGKKGRLVDRLIWNFKIISMIEKPGVTHKIMRKDVWDKPEWLECIHGKTERV